MMNNILTKTNMQKATDSVAGINDITRIAKGTSIKGDVISSSDIRIDGSVTGIVFSEGKIVLGESASVVGSLLCVNLDQWGVVEGEVYIKDTLSLKSASKVKGNINVHRIQVEMGAQINGSCRMISDVEYEKAAAEKTGAAPKVTAVPPKDIKKQ